MSLVSEYIQFIGPLLRDYQIHDAFSDIMRGATYCERFINPERSHKAVLDLVAAFRHWHKLRQKSSLLQELMKDSDILINMLRATAHLNDKKSTEVFFFILEYYTSQANPETFFDQGEN